MLSRSNRLSGGVRRARPLLGTLVDIRADGELALVQEAVERAFATVALVHRLMSFHEHDSEVSRLNREAFRRPVRVHTHTWAVLARARRISDASSGAFDITVAPHLVRWGYLPGSGALPPSRRDGYRAVELLPDNEVRFIEPVLIDLGGIAKGYAVDAACAVLQARGVRDYVVNAGGDLCVGARREWVHVRHPARPGTLVALGCVRQGAVATTGAYFSRGPNPTVNPIVAPASGTPAAYRGSISILASDCTTADALSKVAAVLGAGALPVIASFRAQAKSLSDQGEWSSLPNAWAADPSLLAA
jgi:thiamine biosynthesis lipoprotein